MQQLDYGKQESTTVAKLAGRIAFACLVITAIGLIPGRISNWMPSMVQNALFETTCASVPIGAIFSVFAMARQKRRSLLGWIAFLGYTCLFLYMLVMLKLHGGHP